MNENKLLKALGEIHANNRDFGFFIFGMGVGVAEGAALEFGNNTPYFLILIFALILVGTSARLLLSRKR